MTSVGRIDCPENSSASTALCFCSFFIRTSVTAARLRRPRQRQKLLSEPGSELVSGASQ